MKTVALSLLLVATAILTTHGQAETPAGNKTNIGIDCSRVRVRCARPLCANPVTRPGECCPTCDQSNCKFEGCVRFNTLFGVQWKPNPCKICQCDNERNEPFCAIIDCAFTTEEDCFGFPLVLKPGDCCRTCDFGTPETGCHVVPAVGTQRNITVSDSRGYTRSCATEVRDHTCDKVGFVRRGKKFRCDPVSRYRLVQFDRKSCPVYRAIRQDVSRCRAVEDNSINIGCDLEV